jgi:hypothetical protein
MFKFVSSNEQIIKERNRSRRIASQQNKSSEMSNIMFVSMAESGSISEEDIVKFPEVFKEWETNTHYVIGQIRWYNDPNELYMCDIEHDSQEGWTPDVVSMWHRIGNPNEEYSPWIPPAGSTGVYKLGAKVSHKDKKWVSTVDNNSWEPGVYGWTEVSE